MSETGLVEVREEQKGQAMIESNDVVLGGLRLRKVTGGTAQILEKTKNKLWAGIQPEDGEWMHQLFAFLYVHSKPLAEVVKASRTAEDFELAVIEFGDTFSLANLEELLTGVRDMIEQANVGNDYQVKEDKGAAPSKN